MEGATNSDVIQENRVGQCGNTGSAEFPCVRSASRRSLSPRVRIAVSRGDDSEEETSFHADQGSPRKPLAKLLGTPHGHSLSPLLLPVNAIGQCSDVSPLASSHDKPSYMLQGYDHKHDTRQSTADEPLLFVPSGADNVVTSSTAVLPNMSDLARERDALANEREALSREKADLARQWEELSRARDASNMVGSRLASNHPGKQPVYDHWGRLVGTRKRDAFMLCFRRFCCARQDDSELDDVIHVLRPQGPILPRVATMAPDSREIGRERFSAPPSLPSVNEEAQSLPKDLPPDLYSSAVRSVSVATYISARSRSRESSFFLRRRPNSRSSSRSAGRFSSPFKCDEDLANLEASMLYQGTPIEIFSQTVADTLTKIGLRRDFDDPLIKKMAEPSSDPKANSEIKAQLLDIGPDLQLLVRKSFTPLTFRNLVLGFIGVVDALRDTELSRLVEIFENQWLIKVRPGANKIIDGRRILEDYQPNQVYEFCTSSFKHDTLPFPLADVIEKDRRNHKCAGEGVLWAQRIMELMEGLLRRLFEIFPAVHEETLSQYLSRLSTDTRDWRGYWRDNYSNSRCRHEVLGFVVGKLVDAKMKGSAALLYPPAMVDAVFNDSVSIVDDFLIDLRLAMRMLDLLL